MLYFGWFSAIMPSENFKKHYLLLIPFISYFISYIFAIPNEPAHGWYRYPFYPFLIIAAVLVLRKEMGIWKKNIKKLARCLYCFGLPFLLS